MSRLIILPLCCLILSCSFPRSEQRPITLDDLAIKVKGESREVAYTNKESAVFYTETNAQHRSDWQGLRVMSFEMMEDYRITIEGAELIKQNTLEAKVLPYQIRRSYPAGTQEQVTLLDSIPALVVELKGTKRRKLTAQPLFSDFQRSEDFVTRFDSGVLLIARKNHNQRTEKENYPVWLAVTVASNADESQLLTRPEQFSSNFSPAGLSAEISSVGCAVIFAAADSASEAIALLNHISKNYPQLIQKRKQRMEALLNCSNVHTDDQQFTKALNWTILSLDALIMNQLKKGIFAGLPWFDNYWGRDTYISLPGATLVTGRFKEAKEILRSFAEWQEKNPNDSNFGRIPNLVTTTSMSYNTTDGTPRFVIALEQYVRYSNDVAFARELYPTVKRSTDGAMKYHTDRNGFLTHGDAETWMDAVGPDGPWSPRGNRANDIQVLWYSQLNAGAFIARLAGDKENEQKWSALAEKLKISFNKSFINSTSARIYDHLNPDGTPDTSLRPNQLFVLSLINDDSLRFQIFRTVTERLVYRYGVASLWQEDENFHPYHQYPPYYVKDAAYHNGIVWTWLAGAWIDNVVKYNAPNLAYKVTADMAHQILNRGAVGTLSELLDAAPRTDKREPELSGTYSQAWSLAEFIRTTYQSYFGVTVDANVSKLTLKPCLPASIRSASFNAAIGNTTVSVTYRTAGEKLWASLNTPKEAPLLNIEVYKTFENGDCRNVSFALQAAKLVSIEISKDEVSATENGTIIHPATKIEKNILASFGTDELQLAQPYVNPNLKSLKGPSHRLLTNGEIKTSNPNAHIIADADDPIGDDNGNGYYIYPLTTHLKPGSLDITRFTVSADEKNIYFKLQFRNLSNPGWHPEYGFQLTFAAIVVCAGKGNRILGSNAQYTLPQQYAYEKIIYIGGGLRIVSADGKTLAEYLPIPGDEKNPLGNAATKTIEFSLPIELIGKPSDSLRFAVLVGCQDDHGGAGIGEFRTVESVAKEWIGGGKRNPKDANIYDCLFVAGKSPTH